MKQTNQSKIIKELAEEFNSEFEKTLPFKILPNGGIVYKNYIVKRTKKGSWALYNSATKNFVNEFFLKTCALIAAKEHSLFKFDRYIEIKHLDNLYWSHYSDIVVYKHNIDKIKDNEHYEIVSIKLSESEYRANQYRKQISNKFRQSFV